MQLVLRGAFWIALYVFVSVSPLVFAAIGVMQPGRSFATDFSVALGFIGLAMMGLQFALIARFESVASPFGMDALIQFHRQIAYVALAFLLAHPILLFVTRPRDPLAALLPDRPLAGPLRGALDGVPPRARRDLGLAQAPPHQLRGLAARARRARRADHRVRARARGPGPLLRGAALAARPLGRDVGHGRGPARLGADRQAARPLPASVDSSRRSSPSGATPGRWCSAPTDIAASRSSPASSAGSWSAALRSRSPSTRSRSRRARSRPAISRSR